MLVFRIKINMFIWNKYRSQGISKELLVWEAFEGVDDKMQWYKVLSGINKTRRVKLSLGIGYQGRAVW